MIEADNMTETDNMTEIEVKKLTDEELRIKVAELRGWKFYSSHSYWMEPGTGYQIARTVNELPNYSQDLNAMHSAEFFLSDGQFAVYMSILRGNADELKFMSQHVGQMRLTKATAREKAEAFVLTFLRE